MIDLMLDIETLGRGPGCVVTSVAIIPFNLNGSELEKEVKKFECYLHVGEQMADGYFVDPDTLQWWLKQDDKVRWKAWAGTTSRVQFQEELTAYIDYIKAEHTSYRIWATAPKLDLGCIHALFRDMEYPILFSSERCMRTLRETVKMLYPGKYKPTKASALHDAEDDCIRQIKDIQQCYRILREPVDEAKNCADLSTDNTRVNL